MNTGACHLPAIAMVTTMQALCHVVEFLQLHYSNIIMGMMATQITCNMIVYSTVYSGTDERKHQSYASLSFVRGIHRDRTKGQ